jgi:hypothetical protein
MESLKLYVDPIDAENGKTDSEYEVHIYFYYKNLNLYYVDNSNVMLLCWMTLLHMYACRIFTTYEHYLTLLEPKHLLILEISV